mgnify:CR=1 FL=1
MMDRERPSASDSEEMIPEAWIGQEVMLETTETLSSDLRASAPVYLEDVNDRGIVMLVTRHKDQSQFSRYFYPWSVVGWIRLAEEDEPGDEEGEGAPEPGPPQLGGTPGRRPSGEHGDHQLSVPVKT